MSWKKRRMRMARKTKEKMAIADVIETIDKYHRASGHANVGSCVSESVLFSKLLKKYHRIDSELVCSDIFCWNEKGKFIVENWNLTYNSESDFEAKEKKMEEVFDYLDSIGCPDPYLTECGHDTISFHDDDNSGYQGHLVVQTEFFIVDVTMGQFNRDRLAPMGKYLVWDRSHFRPFSDHKQDWMLEERPQFPTVIRERREDWGELKEESGIRHDDLPPIVRTQSEQTAMMKVGEWTTIMLQLRPELRIERTYDRWEKKSFREGIKRTITIIDTMLLALQRQNQES